MENLPFFIKKGQCRNGKKKGLQRETQNPPGAFIFDPSGKPIS
jgi:hypothetical protein